jgi:DNA-binding response OmpR family regulator
MSARKTILIIEDDLCLTEMLQVHIDAKRNQYKIIIANDGEEGLRKAKTKNPDLIVLDIGLPKMGGIEVYKQLPKENGKTLVPVIVFTARGELEEFFEQIEVEGFISKPFETEALLEEIDLQDYLKRDQFFFAYLLTNVSYKGMVFYLLFQLAIQPICLDWSLLKEPKFLPV